MKKKITIFAFVLTLFFSTYHYDVLAASPSSTIQELQKKVTALSKKVKSLTSSLVTKNKEIKDIKSKLNIATKDKNNLQQQIQVKDKVISNQKQEIEELNKKLKEVEQLKKASTIYTDINGNAVPQDSPGAIKWYGFKTEMTTIYMTPNAYDKFSYLISTSDGILKEISRYFGTTKLSQEIPVYIYFDEPINKTRGGDYFTREKRIFIRGNFFKPFNPKADDENLVGVYTHEFTHAFQDLSLNLNEIRGNRFNSEMFWLSEGMANYVDHQYIEYKNFSIPSSQLTMTYKYNKEHYRKDILNSLRLINKNANDLTSLADDSFFRGYAIGESMNYFIEKQYGHEKFFQFIEGLKTQSISDSMLKNFGVTEKQFINEWITYYSL